MPEEIVEQITSLFSTMTLLIAETLFMYMVLPLILVLVLAKFILNIRGILLNILFGVTALLGLVIFSYYGVPGMLEQFQSSIK